MCVITLYVAGKNGFRATEGRVLNGRHLSAGEVSAMAAKLEWWERAYLEAAGGDEGGLKMFRSWMYLQASTARELTGWSVENDAVVKRMCDLAARWVLQDDLSLRIVAMEMGITWRTFGRRWMRRFAVVLGQARTVEATVRVKLEKEFYG